MPTLYQHTLVLLTGLVLTLAFCTRHMIYRRLRRVYDAIWPQQHTLLPPRPPTPPLPPSPPVPHAVAREAARAVLTTLDHGEQLTPANVVKHAAKNVLDDMVPDMPIPPLMPGEASSPSLPQRPTLPPPPPNLPQRPTLPPKPTKKPFQDLFSK
jgi:hypothetical protein